MEQPIQTPEEELKELRESLTNIQFLSDQVRFNSVIYQGLNLIIGKLDKLEEKIDGLKK